MVNIKFEILGKSVFVRGLTRYAALVKDWRPAFEQIHTNYIQVTRKNFQSQGSPHRWKSLSPEYRKWKQRHFPGKKILQRSGALIDSMTARNQIGARHTIKDIKKLSAEFGTTLPYAVMHQSGTRRMAARPPVQIPDKTLTFWTRLLQEWAYRELTKPMGLS